MSAVAFSAQQAQLAKYAYERLVYTPWPFAGTGTAPSLSTLTTQLFQTSSWNSKGSPTWQAAIEMVQTMQNSQVNLLWTNDQQNRINSQNTGQTNAARSGQRQMPTYRPAVDSISLSIQNLTGAAVSPWNTAYAMGMRRLYAVDKLLARRANITSQGGWYNLTPAETEALKSLDLQSKDGAIDESGLAQMMALVDKGTQPVSIQRLMTGVMDNREMDGGFDLFYPDVSASDNQFATYDAQMDPVDPTRGRFVVLTDIALEGGSMADNNVTITVDRDNDKAYVQLQGGAFQQSDDEPWHLWVPAVDALKFHVVQGPNSAVTQVPIRIRVLEFEMSEILAVQFGLVTTPTALTKPSVYYKTIVGLV